MVYRDIINALSIKSAKIAKKQGKDSFQDLSWFIEKQVEKVAEELDEDPVKVMEGLMRWFEYLFSEFCEKFIDEEKYAPFKKFLGEQTGKKERFQMIELMSFFQRYSEFEKKEKS